MKFAARTHCLQREIEVARRFSTRAQQQARVANFIGAGTYQHYLSVPGLLYVGDQLAWVDRRSCPLTIGPTKPFGPDSKALLKLVTQFLLHRQSDAMDQE